MKIFSKSKWIATFSFLSVLNVITYWGVGLCAAELEMDQVSSILSHYSLRVPMLDIENTPEDTYAFAKKTYTKSYSNLAAGDDMLNAAQAFLKASQQGKSEAVYRLALCLEHIANYQHGTLAKIGKIYDVRSAIVDLFKLGAKLDNEHAFESNLAYQDRKERLDPELLEEISQ